MADSRLSLVLAVLAALALSASCAQDISPESDGGIPKDGGSLPVLRDSGPGPVEPGSGDAGTPDAEQEPGDPGVPPSLCGNDRIEAPERCDGFDLDSRTCRDLGFASGSLSCKDTCADFAVENCAPLVATAIAAPGASVSLGGSLDIGDPRWQRPLENCAPSGSAGHLFDAFAVVNNGSVLRRVNITAAFNGNGTLHAMRSPFKPQQAVPACLAGGENMDGNPALSGIVELAIPAGATVVVVVSTYEAQDPIGTYQIDIATLLDDVGGAVCGNGVVEAGELCDGTALGGATCASRGYSGGSLSCGANCLALVESGCTSGPVTTTASPIAAPGGQITLTGALHEGSPLWNRPFETCTPGESVGNPYEVKAVVNQTGAPQVIRVQAAWEDDGFLHVYSSPFDASAPGMGCLAGNDDFGGDVLASRIDEVTIAAGATLVIVASSYLPNDPIGPFTLTVRTLEASVCGNNDQEGAEVCDGTDLAGQACLFRGFDGGRLACTAGCNAFVERDCFAFEPVRDIAGPGASVTLSGSIDSSDPRFARPSETCAASGLPANRPFDAWLVRNQSSSPQTLEVTASWAGDGFLLAYSAGFDSTAPTLGCLTGNDDDGSDQSKSRIEEIPIAAGQTIVLIATAYAADAAIGPYSLQVTTKQGPVCGDGIINGNEQCDGAAFGGATCSSRGHDGGLLACGACLLQEGNCFSYVATTSIPASNSSTEFLGSLTVSDPRWDRPSATCGGTPGAVDHPFDAYRLRNDTGATQRISVLVDWTGGGDGFLHAYTDSFDSAAPRSAACVVGNDDRQPPDRSQSEIVDLELAPNQVVVIVPSSFAGGVYPGAYRMRVETKPVGLPPPVAIAQRGATMLLSGSLEASDPKWGPRDGGVRALGRRQEPPLRRAHHRQTRRDRPKT
jgi:hypothetical protein